MDKYEYNLKLEEINRLADEENYEDAASVADTIDWKRVRNVHTLCMVSEIYEANNRLEDSKEVLMKAYRRAQMGRAILYRLTEVCIKLREFDEAVEYYSEYVDAAPHDNSRYILKYKIYRGRGSSLEDQIAILEEYKSKENTEKWSYELAKLYQRAGNEKKCIETCDDLVLWFRQGKYVIKALELKKTLTDLTPAQQMIYDHRNEMPEEPETDREPRMQEIEKVIVERMPSSEQDALTDSIISETQKELAMSVAQQAAEAEPEAYTGYAGAYEQPAAPEEPKEPAERIPTEEPEAEEPADILKEATKIIPVKDIREARRAAISRQMAQEMGQPAEAEKPEEQMAEAEPAPKEEPVPQAEETEEEPQLRVEEPAASETAAPAEEPAPAAEKAEPAQEAPKGPNYDMARLQAELANSMREIVSGIRRPESDDGIVEPKNDLSSFADSAGTDDAAAETASIDDILLSMSGITEEVKPASDEIPAAPVIPEPKAEPAAPAEAVSARKQQPEPGKEKPAPTKNIPVKDVKEAREIPVQTKKAESAEPAQTVPEVFPNARQQEETEIPANTYRKTGLTRSQQQILGYFATIGGLREQIASALEDTTKKVLQDKTSRSGNLIITGAAGSGRSTLAMRYAKAVSRAKGDKSARIAKIYAEDFNKKDIPSTVAKIAGGTLIIEEAGDLTEEVVNQLSKAMEFRTDSLVVVLEDEKGYLKEMLDHHPDFAEKFTSAIEVPIFTNDELVSFGQSCALEDDYRIDEAAISALYDRIGAMQTPEHPVTVADVRDIVDGAMKRADHAGLGKLGRILTKKRYDAENRVVLYAKDFR